jgi:hypothetical protein
MPIMSTAAESYLLSVPIEEKDEELQMTFQVAMVGSDGLMVGSDKLVVDRTREPGRRTQDSQFASGDKFCANRDGSLICFYAGGPQSKSIADAVTVQGNPAEENRAAWHYQLQKIAETILANSVGDEVLVIRPNVDLSLIHRTGKEVSVPPVIADRICTGVYAKSRFFVENFWERRSLKELRKLMFVALGCAAIERPESVGRGFDLLTITKEGCSWETFSENSPEIREAVDEMMSTVDAVLFPATQNQGVS